MPFDFPHVPYVAKDFGWHDPDFAFKDAGVADAFFQEFAKQFTVDGDDYEGEIDAILTEFDQRDLDNDEIKSGALDDWLKENDELPMLWSHLRHEPIGVWSDFRIDGKFLRAKGELIDGIQRSKEAVIFIKREIVKGVSIGFNATEYSYRFNRDVPGGDFGVDFDKITLREASLVLYPAAPNAAVTALKGQPADVVKAFLVNEKGLSDEAATRITGAEAPVPPPVSKSVAEALAEMLNC